MHVDPLRLKHRQLSRTGGSLAQYGLSTLYSSVAQPRIVREIDHGKRTLRQGRQRFLEGQFNWNTDTIKAVLVDTGTYTVNLSAHEFC